MTESMRIRSRDGATDTSRSKTYANVHPKNSDTIANKLIAVKTMAQKMTALSANVYSGSDYILTYATDTGGDD